jgi:hypothetical protein
MELNNRPAPAPLGCAPFDVTSEPETSAVHWHAPQDNMSVTSTVAAYLLALLLGVGITLYMIPAHLIFASDALAHPVAGDVAVHVIGQRYFVADSWRWPLLTAKPLVTPEGTNIAFMDSIPLIAIPMKVFRHYLPPGFHSIFLWLALSWVAQPVAAVFALRSTGERRLVPCFAVALIALSMPTLLRRFGHSALCGHFLLLIALGFYFRITRSVQTQLLVMAGVLMLAALLVNPYLMYMVIAILASAPLTLLIRGDHSWIRVACGVVAGIGITGAVAIILGYNSALPMPGFGYYSMNLLSPFYPFGSSFFGALVGPMDATGGQYEGYQYLGVGVLLLVAIATFCLARRGGAATFRRHAGIVLACIALTTLSLSTRVYAGHYLLLDLSAPDWLLQLRTTGRFFWPVTYTAVIAGVAIVCRCLSRRIMVALLLLAALLQVIEANGMRQWLRYSLHKPQQWSLNIAQLRPLLAEHSKLTVWPRFLCGADHVSAPFLQTFLLASEVAIPVNTMYVSRYTTLPKCDALEAPVKVDPGELLIFMPPAPPASVMQVEGWRHMCRRLGVLTACSQKLRDRADLSTPAIPAVSLNNVYSTAANGSGIQELSSGWSTPESWGVWSDGAVARLIVGFAEPIDKALTLTVRARGLAVHPAMTQTVSVVANGRPVAIWDLNENSFGEYKASIPAPSNPDEPMVIEFHIQYPISPREDGLGADDRKLGFALSEFRVDRLSK